MKKIIVLIIFLAFLSIIKFFFLDNVNILLDIASGLDQPSSIHNIVMDRIYRIIERKNTEGMLLDQLRNGRNPSRRYLCIRILGVIGDKNSLASFIDIYKKHQDEKRSVLLYSVFESIGLLGENKAVPFLKTALDNKLKWEALNYPIVESLFFLTGKRYEFINPNGDMQAFYPSEDEIQARNIVLATKGRKRTYKEMILLDKLFRK